MSKTILLITLLTLFLGGLLAGLAACYFIKPQLSAPEGARSTDLPNSGTMEERLFVPTIDLEATVVSLSEDPPDQICNGQCVYYPEDTGIIRVDKVIKVDPSSIDDLLINVKELVGSEVKVNFRYSHRPAKLRYILSAPPSEPQSSSSGSPVERPLYKPVLKENGYLIYTFEVKSVDRLTEIVLPGLKTGSRFRAWISFFSPSRGIVSLSEGIIDVYEVVP